MASELAKRVAVALVGIPFILTFVYLGRAGPASDIYSLGVCAYQFIARLRSQRP